MMRFTVGYGGGWKDCPSPDVAGAVYLGEWNHVVAVYDDGFITTYSNGEIIGEATYTEKLIVK